MQKSKFFQVSGIGKGTTRITGLGGECCYLLEGSGQALLIDSLAGAGNLKAFVRELTDLPVMVVNTHGHVDHCGGNFDYGECYIHPNDIRLMYEHGSREMRKGFVDSMARFHSDPPAIGLEDFTPSASIKTYPVYEGDVFELGGRQIEVIQVPGHSTGTIVLLDRERKMLFSGDACNVNTLVFSPHATSIEEYLDSLLHLKGYAGAFDSLYGGHGPEPVPAVIVDEAIELCQEILEGTDDQIENVYSGFPCYYAKAKDERFRRVDGKMANIAYSKSKIHRPDSVVKIVNQPDKDELKFE